MRIAIIGIRGVPANYGGLEDCAEEVGKRLAARGHEVAVYCRKGSYGGPGHQAAAGEYQGIRRITLPSLKTKVADTYSHSLLCMFHVLSQKPDVIWAFNPGIATLCTIPKLLGHRIVLHADGFDWRRKKWGWLARTFIHQSARLAARICDGLILDAASARDYCDAKFRCRRPPIYIPNGTKREESERPEVIREYGLEKDGYFLFLSRIAPDNSCDTIIRAFEGLKTEKKLVLGGSAAEDGSYMKGLRRTPDPRILFPGPIYDPVHVKELHYGSYALLHGNLAGGTSIGLLKGLAFGTCVLSPDTPDNAYVVGDAGVLYKNSAGDLRAKMQFLLDNYDAVARYRREAVRRIGAEYDWDNIADRYEELFAGIAAGRRASKVLPPAPPRKHWQSNAAGIGSKE